MKQPPIIAFQSSTTLSTMLRAHLCRQFNVISAILFAWTFSLVVQCHAFSPATPSAVSYALRFQHPHSQQYHMVSAVEPWIVDERRRSPSIRTGTTRTTTATTTSSFPLSFPPYPYPRTTALVDNCSDDSLRITTCGQEEPDDVTDSLHHLLQEKVQLYQRELETQRQHYEALLEARQHETTQQSNKKLQQSDERTTAFLSDQHEPNLEQLYALPELERRKALAKEGQRLERDCQVQQKALEKLENEIQECHHDCLELSCEWVRLTVQMERAQDAWKSINEERQASQAAHEHAWQEQEEANRRLLEQVRQQHQTTLTLSAQSYTRQIQQADAQLHRLEQDLPNVQMAARNLDDRIPVMEEQRSQFSFLVGAMIALLLRRVARVVVWTGQGIRRQFVSKDIHQDNSDETVSLQPLNWTGEHLAQCFWATLAWSLRMCRRAWFAISNSATRIHSEDPADRRGKPSYS